MRMRRILLGLFVFPAVLLSGCVEISKPSHVRFGQQPRYADENVRFRATYYFRVFDLCESVGLPSTETASSGGDALFVVHKGRRLRLLKDSLYRFTMTGKSEPSNRVIFESGTLPSWQIDPLGASVKFSEEANGFFVETAAERQRNARRGEARKELKRLFDQRRELAESLEDDAEAKSTMLGLVDDAIKANLRELGPVEPSAGPAAVQTGAQLANARAAAKEVADLIVTVSSEAPAKDHKTALSKRKEAIDAINKSINERATAEGASIAAAKATLENEISALEKTIENVKQKNELVTDATKKKQTAEKIEALTKKIASAKIELGKLSGFGLFIAGTTKSQNSCSEGSSFRRGFQIMGPEGVRTFDQDERLILAMSSSAKPVISLMQQTANRVLDRGATPAARLVPVLQAQKQVLEAHRELDKAVATGKSAGDIVNDVLSKIQADGGQG